jgi:hypothetical protein
MATEDRQARLKEMEDAIEAYEARLEAQMAADGVTLKLAHTGRWEDVDRLCALRIDYGRARGIEIPSTYLSTLEGCYGPFHNMAGRRLYFETWARTHCPALRLLWVDPPVHGLG